MPGSLVGNSLSTQEVSVVSMDSVAARPTLLRRLAVACRREAVRLRVMAVAAELDEELAEGIDPRRELALTLRAAQICSPRYRRGLAAGIERLVREADAGEIILSAALPFQHEQVKVAKATLVSLAQALRSAEPVSPRGVALADRLIRDPDSPLYARTARGGLQLQAQAALEQLQGGGAFSGLR